MFEINVILPYQLNMYEKNVLDLIEKNVKITKSEIITQVKISQNLLKNILDSLTTFEYIKKENPNFTRSPWIVLKNSSDSLTQYTFDGNKIHILKDTPMDYCDQTKQN